MLGFSSISEYSISEIPADAVAVVQLPFLLKLYGGQFGAVHIGRGFAWALLVFVLISRS